MKTAKLSLMFLACTAAIPAFAQNTTDSRCGMTNFDRTQNMFTIASPNPATSNEQCFITVVPKASWTGGMPDLASSEFVEGNYDITLSGGGGGGGGGGAASEQGQNGGGGEGGTGAVPVTSVRYLNPGVYRLTIGSGGQGGVSNGGHAGDGAPTSLSNANSGETVAGFSRAEYWDGGYPQNNAAGVAGRSAYQSGSQADYFGAPATHGERGAFGGANNSRVGDRGNQGGNGFIKMALKDPVPQAAPAMSSTESVTTPAPAATRPARKDRN